MIKTRIVASFEVKNKELPLHHIDFWVAPEDHIFNEMWKAAEMHGISIETHNLIDLRMSFITIGQ